MFKNLKIAVNDDFLKEDEYIFKKYKLIKRISKGTFGNIYSVIRLKDQKVFAMKTEKINSKGKMLESEAYYLYTLQGYGIPKLISYGHTKKYNILIETLLDKSLHYIFIKNNKQCNINDLCLIAIQLIDRLEWIHSKYIVYRDIKPENFLLGSDDPNVIYIVDFGLCKKYRSSKTGKHILPKMTGKFSGTLPYSSVNAVKGKVLSRRDDLISLGYVLIKLIKKHLPWASNFSDLNVKTYNELINLKETNAYGKLFEFVPDELAEFVEYSKKLKFEQDPDYSYLRSLFIKILDKKHLNYKTLLFTFLNQNDKKTKILPRNNSMRRSSPQYRILKNMREERIKRTKSETMTDENLKTNQNFNDISLSKKHNIQTSIKKDKYIKYNNLNLNNISHEKCLNNLKSVFNLKNKDNNYLKEIPKYKYIKKIIFNRKNNLQINSNENSTKNKRIINNKSLLLNNDENIYNNLSKKEKIKNRIKTMFKMNESNANFNNKRQKIPACPSINRIRFFKEKPVKSIIYKNALPFPLHMRLKEELNLSNNIHYKSPLLRNNNSYINQKYQNLNNIPTNKGNLIIKNNSYIKKNENLSDKYKLNHIKSFYSDNLINDLNIILINNSIKLVKNGKNISLKNNYNI